MEAGTTAGGDLGPSAKSGPAGVDGALRDVEIALAGGDFDLGRLGFWRLVARVKRDDALIAQYADRIGRIDTTAFRSWARVRVPVPVGNAALLVAAGAGLAATVAATGVESPLVAGALLLGAGGVWSVALHCPTHWIVGRLFGIRFTDYFIGGPPPPRPGLKSDYATYLRVEPARRAWMHASGAIATKLAPLLALAWWPATTTP